MKPGIVLKQLVISSVWNKPLISDPFAKLVVFEPIVVDSILLEILEEEFEKVSNFWIKILYSENKVGWISLTPKDFEFVKNKCKQK